MKNIPLLDFHTPENLQINQFFRIMKVTAFFLFFFVFCLMAENSNSQNAKVSISKNNTSIEDVLNEIESQTNYLFIYNHNVNVNRKVSVKVSGKPVSEVLESLLHNTNIHYSMEGTHIILSEREEANGTASVTQQNKRFVSGKVTDVNGEPIIGANVQVKGTSSGTITDIEGNFNLEAPENATLVVTFVGFATTHVATGNKKNIVIKLTENSKELEEVVVVGYGTQKKVTVTGSLASTSGQNISRVPTASVTNTLAGQLPGLISVNRSGEPGYDDATLLIRGKSTTGDASPLVVVDGVADRAGGFARIDPNDIESVTILKDASAAIYGSRAANGVILVTTKRGKSGKAKVNYTGNIAFSHPTVLPEMCDSWQYAQLQNEIETTVYGRSRKYTDEQIALYKNGTDPTNYANVKLFDQMIKKASIQTQHNVSLSGGNDIVKYFVSLGYQYQDNYYKKSASDYDQYNLRSNIDITPYKNLRATVNISARQEDRNGPLYGSEDIWRYMVKYDPMVNVYWPGTNYPTTASQDNYNPATAVDNSMGYQKNKASYFNADITLHYDMPFITKGLSVDAGGYIDRSDYFYKKFSKSFNLYAKEGENNYVARKYGPSNADLSENMSQNLGITFNARVNYTRTFNDVHNLSAFVAYEQYKSRYDYLYGYRQDFISSSVDELFAGDKKTVNNDGTASETARQNYFGRLDYNYSNKYLFQFNWRYDGSENFPKGKRFGFFPGVSLGWRISEEKFWKENITFMDYLKLRASWGQMGNDKVSAFQYMTTYTFSSAAILGGSTPATQTGVWQNRTANPNITWEVANTYNVGLESRFLNAFDFSLDLFKTKRHDILATRNAAIPDYSGLTLPDENIGKCSSWGTEASLNYNKKIGDIKFNVGGNFTYAKSRIDYIDEAEGTVEWQKRTGKPIGANWLMYEATGIFRTQADLDNNPHLSNAKLGDLMFRDVNDDKVINGNDKVRLEKTPVPEIIFGINLGLQYKQWSLNTLWQGAGNVYQYTFFESGTIGNFTKDFYNNRWTADNINAKYPKVYDRQVTVTGEKNTFWLENASYLRLKNIELAYTLPQKVLSKLSIGAMRVYLTGYNMLTFTGMKNLDPETAEGGQGFASWSTPQSRVVNFGVNITF